jgi:hypothetical protein
VVFTSNTRPSYTQAVQALVLAALKQPTWIFVFGVVIMSCCTCYCMIQFFFSWVGVHDSVFPVK